MSKEPLLYDQVVEVTADYLGPAAERFIERQIQNHLQKEPRELTRKDLQKLVEWTRLSVAMLTDDQKMLDDFTISLNELAEGNAAK